MKTLFQKPLTVVQLIRQRLAGFIRENYPQIKRIEITDTLEHEFMAKECVKVVDNWLTCEAWGEELTYPFWSSAAM